MKRVQRSFFNELKRSAVKICKCWRIECADGGVFAFTEHDRPLLINGDTYLPSNGFSSSSFSQKNDLSVANINVVALMSDTIREDDLHAGRFDNADVKIFAVFWDKLHLGTMPLMGARFGEVTFREGDFETELRSKAQRLQQKTGRVYELECDAVVGDNRCKVDLADFTFTGTVEALHDNIGFYDYSRTEVDDYFQYGVITFTSGLNDGRRIEVKGSKGSFLVMLEPPAYVLELGTTYSITAGCDNTPETCKAKFDNIFNYRGFPDMPTEQEATETPDAK